MAGTDARFNANQFRDAIRFAMNMGLPNSTSERATFIWDTKMTFPIADSSGTPFDFSASPGSTITFSDVQIPIAVEPSDEGDVRAIRIGEMNVPRVTITVLDEDFDQLTQNEVFANKVTFNEAIYKILYVGPPMGLFDVTVYQIYAQAIDESV